MMHIYDTPYGYGRIEHHRLSEQHHAEIICRAHQMRADACTPAWLALGLLVYLGPGAQNRTTCEPPHTELPHGWSIARLR